MTRPTPPAAPVFKCALYFGCIDKAGHYLTNSKRETLWDTPPSFPWNFGHLDSGLLKAAARKLARLEANNARQAANNASANPPGPSICQ